MKIMPKNEILVDVTFKTRLHHAICIFELTAINEIIRVRESDTDGPRLSGPDTQTRL